MALLTLKNVSKSYGTEPVLKDVSFAVPKGRKVGIIGENGVGKSTLLKLIAGIEHPDSGTVNLYGSLSVGYLRQDIVEKSEDVTLYELIHQVFTDLVKTEDYIHRLEWQMADPEFNRDETALTSLFKKYNKAVVEFEERGGYTFESRIRGTLFGLGFAESDFNRPLKSLSGGEKIRAVLAKLLLSEPDLLLLDEPTNHVDLKACRFLEEDLREYRGTLIIVSHDRYLLNRIPDYIIDVRRGGIEEYPGNYSFYLKERENRLARQEKLYQAYLEKREKLAAFVRRYKAGRKARQAKGREKMLARLEEIGRPDTKERAMNLAFSSSRSGAEVLKVENITLGYNGSPVLQNISLTARRGERIALIGPNGVGKTTLLKALAGLLEPLSGTISLGYNVEVGYFAQDFHTSNGNNTVLEEIVYTSSLDKNEARAFLAQFLFSQDEVDKVIRNLSGGERNRVALAKLVLSQANLLFLDEPTNHLDLSTREVLEEALSDYAGTILFASHDRYFITALATRYLVFDKTGVYDYRGSFEDIPWFKGMVVE